ncbi:MAG: MotE family protein [Alphaproteobacteria bacterium]
MRAIELASPREFRRRLSPLPVTLSALVALLALKLAAFVPASTTAEIAAVAMPLADVAPAAPAATPAHPELEQVASAGSPAALQAPAPTDAAAERRTAGVIDELLAPAAGGGADAAAADAAGGDDPLAAEPFLEERRALARQREALKVRQLAVDVAEERLRELVDELSALKREIDARLAELEAGDEERLARLVKLYEKMRPKEAALIFDDLDFEVLVPLALAMNERKLAPIIAAMTPEVARELTGEVAAERADAELAAALEETRR